MLPGPTLIVKPIGCATPLKITTLASGNTFGAVFWSDGKREAPMLPEQPWLRKHPGEMALFWSDDWVELADLPFDGAEEEAIRWAGLPYAETPTAEDYFAALAVGIGDSDEKLRYLRTRLWWAGNDPIRKSGAGELPLSHIDNLSRLALLLAEDDPQQRLMKAEVFRELGFFKDALGLLEWDFPEELRGVAGELAQLAIRKDVRVARFSW